MEKVNDRMIGEASEFIRGCYAELGRSKSELEKRLHEVASSIIRTGTYSHTAEELEWGAKLAWRNNSRCIGRLFWKTLEVFDARELDSEEEIVQALFHHLAYGTNEGRVRPAITVFAPKSERLVIRIWNHQLIRYAGYETEHGIVGDPASVELTKQCMQLGWQGEGTPHDVLPLVIQVNDRMPRWFPIPEQLVLEVPIMHPKLGWFEDLGLKWYGVPFISDMLLEIGGLHYTAAPFNGWYMATEIAARNLADEHRYNKLPLIAEKLGLDSSTNITFWKDRTLIELNEAVYYSFRSNKVSIVDHHTASEQFMLFEQQEQEMNREVNGRWSWLIPPLSPAATSIWHKSYTEFEQSPNYLYQESPYSLQASAKPPEPQCPYHEAKAGSRG